MNTKEKLLKIKKILENNVGRKVLLTIKKGKQECVQTKAVIEDVFTSFFTVEIVTEENKKRICSYSYFDVLNSTITLKSSC